MVKKLIASSALCAGALYRWTMKNSLEIWRRVGRNRSNSISLRLILFTDPDSVIDKYQSWCVVNYLWFVNRRLMPSLTKRKLFAQALLLRRLLGWLIDLRTVGDSCVFDVATVNTFSSVNKLMLTLLGEYFKLLFWIAESCMGVRFTQLWGMAIFEHKYFTR